VSDSAVLTSAGSSFHHCGTRREKSWDLAEQCLPVLSEGATSRASEVVKVVYVKKGITYLNIGSGIQPG